MNYRGVICPVIPLLSPLFGSVVFQKYCSQSHPNLTFLTLSSLHTFKKFNYLAQSVPKVKGLIGENAGDHCKTQHALLVCTSLPQSSRRSRLLSHDMRAETRSYLSRVSLRILQIFFCQYRKKYLFMWLKLSISNVLYR